MSNLQVVKRDGRVVDFDRSRIERAVERCFAECGDLSDNGKLPLHSPVGVARYAKQQIEIWNECEDYPDQISVEKIQDLVEIALMQLGYPEAARAYILYREKHRQLRDERPIPEDVKLAFAKDEAYFPTPLQRFQFVDKYSRYNPTLGRRETWVETVDRSVDFLYELAGDRLDREIYDEVRNGILEMRVTPSMRLLAMAGPAARRNSMSIYNCSYSVADSLDVFTEALLISMAGCGFGYSVESKYVDRLPLVLPAGKYGTSLWTIEDSSEGWAEALRYGLEAWFTGWDVQFDYTFIRPAGSILQTKGGRASGPDPLRQMLEFCRSRVLSRQGRRLRPVDVHDMLCMIGQCVVSGGVRRTAMISLFDEDDQEMLLAKSGDFEREHSYRWNANNSAVRSAESMSDHIQFVDRFMQMVRDGRGEPGIFSREVAQNMKPLRRAEATWGTNPCFAAGTMVQTDEGDYPIEDLIGKSVRIWNGESWQRVDNFRITSENEPMLKITMHDGSEMRATRYHSFILDDDSRLPAYELTDGMKLQISTAPSTHGRTVEPGAYLKGFLLAEGTQANGRPILWLYGPKHGCQDRLIESATELQIEQVRTNAVASLGFKESWEDRLQMTGLACRKEQLLNWATQYKFGLPREVFQWDHYSKTEFIAGLLDGDGTASDSRNGFLYQIGSISKVFLQDVQSLLKTMGVYSHLSLCRLAGMSDFGDGYGAYPTKEAWRLTIGQASSVALAKQVTFSRLVSFSTKKLAYNVKPKFNRIAKIELDGADEKVYCCTVEGSHSFSLTNGLHVGQCGEIVLRPQEFCNLSAAIVRPSDTFDSLAEKVRLATIIGTIQSLATTFPGLRPTWKKNCEDERLLGVDITGQMDNPDLLTEGAFNQFRLHAQSANEQIAKRLGINRSAAITCVKPSGNSSQLLDASSGLHARWAPYYVRNVRISGSSPVARVLRDAGVPMAPENGDDTENPRTWVVSFPVAAPQGAITRNDRSAVEQCEWWLRNKTYWTEHNPSVTITYKPDEIIPLMSWVYEHRDKIGGMAFLPSFDAKYDQLPYIEISKEEYERRVAEFPVIDYSKIWRYETEDMSKASTTGACEGPICLLNEGA